MTFVVTEVRHVALTETTIDNDLQDVIALEVHLEETTTVMTDLRDATFEIAHEALLDDRHTDLLDEMVVVSGTKIDLLDTVLHDAITAADLHADNSLLLPYIFFIPLGQFFLCVILIYPEPLDVKYPVSLFTTHL